MTDPRRYLADTGQIYVTPAAAQQAAGRCEMDVEDARRLLTDLLCEAVQVSYESPELWRFRRRSAEADVSARVTREGRLAVVVSVSVRSHYRPPEGRRGR